MNSPLSIEPEVFRFPGPRSCLRALRWRLHIQQCPSAKRKVSTDWKLDGNAITHRRCKYLSCATLLPCASPKLLPIPSGNYLLPGTSAAGCRPPARRCALTDPEDDRSLRRMHGEMRKSCKESFPSLACSHMRTVPSSEHREDGDTALVRFPLLSRNVRRICMNNRFAASSITTSPVSQPRVNVTLAGVFPSGESVLDVAQHFLHHETSVQFYNARPSSLLKASRAGLYGLSPCVKRWQMLGVLV